MRRRRRDEKQRAAAVETHRGQRLEETHSDEQGTRRERQQRDSAQIANAQRKRKKEKLRNKNDRRDRYKQPPNYANSTIRTPGHHPEHLQHMHDEQDHDSKNI